MKNILFPPHFTDERKTETARLQYVLILTIILAATVGIFVAIVLPHTARRWFLMIGIVYVLCLIFLVLIRRGHTALASWLMTLSFWIVATGLAVTAGGIHAPAIALYLILVLFAGMLLGEIIGFITAGVCALTILLLVYAGQAGILPSTAIHHTPMSLWVTYTEFFTLVAGFQYLAARSIKRSFHRMEQELQERQKTETALRESEAKYRRLIETTAEGYWIISTQGLTVDVNKALCHMLGYEKEEMIDKSPLEFADDENRKIFTESISMIAEKDHRSYEITLRKKNGQPVHTFFNATTLQDEAGIVQGSFALVTDITLRHQAINELRRSEEKYRSILENMEEGYYEVDLNGNYTFANDAMCRILGYAKDEMIGMNYRKLTADEESTKEIFKIYERIFYQDKPEKGFTWQLLRKDNSLIMVELSISLIKNGTGKTVGFKGVFRDVTDQKRAEKELEQYRQHLEVLVAERTNELAATNEKLHLQIAEREHAEESLRQSEEKYRTLVENVNIGVYRNTGQINSRFLHANPALVRMFGYDSLAEFMQIRVMDLYQNPDERKAFLSSLMETGSVKNMELRLRKKDGAAIWASVSAIVHHDSAGNIDWIDGVIEDITDRKKTEEERREYERRLADIISFLPDATLVIDKDGKVIAWNRAMEELTGLKAENMLGKGNYEYALPFYGVRRPILIDLVFLSREEFEAKYSKFARYGEILSAEAYMPTLRGGGVYLSATAAALRDSQGNIAGAIELIRDITKSKRAEEALEEAKEAAEAATQAKSAFLATMSHEIRTPMNAVIGMASLLLDTPLSAEQREFAETVRNSGDSLLAIINDILDFSKIEAGRMEMERQPFDLRECVEGAIDLLATRAAEKKLNLVYLMDERVPPAIIGDVTRVRQILVNLLSNAVKFTEQGDIEVGVDCPDAGAVSPDQTDALQPPVTLRFSVKDSGIGIPAERMDRLFQSFSQVDASTTRRYGGTGLGLIISKRLAELMGGGMCVESKVGQGSTFSFTIPAQATSLPKHADQKKTQVVLRGKRVLIADDNATNRRILMLQTQGWGMVPRAAASPFEALEWIRKGDLFDFAILDMQMRDMDGITLASEIRKLRDAQAMPLIMLSSLGQRESGREDAYDVCLTKPVKASQLYNMLVDIMGMELAPTAEEKPLFDAGMANKHPLRILLAEDNVINQKLTLQLLKRMGYRADVAGNGLEAIDALRRQPYDLVLMDIQMPEMDGLEASRAICREWPRERRPRIVAMTANVMNEDREACFAAGMDGFIGKPIRVEELAEALYQCKPVEGGKEQRPHTSEAPVEAPVVSLGKTASSPLDPGALKRLHEMAGGDETFVREMVNTFLTDAPVMLRELRESLASGDAAVFRRVAHSLKSNSRDFGALELSELSRRMEMMGKAGALEGAEKELSQAEAEYDQVSEALKRL